MRKNQHKTLWTVVYSSGAIRRFTDEEDAKAEAYLFGWSIVPPLYR